MGASSSKQEPEEDKSGKYIKRQIGKRSSVNILKRAEPRKTSTPTFSAASCPTQYDGSSEPLPWLDLKKTNRTETTPSPESDRSDASTVVRRYSSESLDATCISLSTASETTAEEAKDKGNQYKTTTNGKRRNVAPVSGVPPTSSLRQQAAPQKDDARDDTRDEKSKVRAQARRRTASGPELFRVSGVLQWNQPLC